MITEDYVSFETAKLLKEKDFNEACRMFYCKPHEGYLSNNRRDAWWNSDLRKDMTCTCPTLQMAMKWLREVHNLCIEPYRTACGYLYTISKIWTGSEIYSDEFNGDDEDSGQWTTYEKAVEAAIKYSLENLI